MKAKIGFVSAGKSSMPHYKSHYKSFTPLIPAGVRIDFHGWRSKSSQEGRSMEKTKSDPIIIEQAGMRMTVAHRHGVGGTDEGLTFDITTAGSKDEGKRILRFDCFYKNPHYHVGPSGGLDAAHKMKEEGIEDPVRWTLEQLKTRFPAMIKQAGYEEIAAKIDQQSITDQLTRLEPEILTKY